MAYVSSPLCSCRVVHACLVTSEAMCSGECVCHGPRDTGADVNKLRDAAAGGRVLLAAAATPAARAAHTPACPLQHYNTELLLYFQYLII